MQIVITGDYFEMSRKVADLVVNQVRTLPDSVFALPTGNTPFIFYRELVEAFKKGKVDFSSIKVFNLDEYVGLGPKHMGSYAFYMYARLFSNVNIEPHHTDIPNGLAKDLFQECKRYEASVKASGGLDMAVLGLGTNGHIGFNEPGTSFRSTTHVAKLSKSTIDNNLHDFGDVNEMPKKAITMGLRTIMQAKKIVLMASGPRKAQAIHQLVQGHVSTEVPASILQTHDDVTLIIDEAAAAELKKHGYEDQKKRDFTIYHEHTLPRGKKIAVLAPHPDDSSISAGGTISMLAPHNEITILNMTSGHRAYVPALTKRDKIALRRKEAFAEAKVLDAKCEFLQLKFYDAQEISEADVKKLLQHLRAIDPEIVFLAPINDHHPTHKLSTEIGIKAIKRLVNEKKHSIELWHYESPWSMFQPGAFNALVQLPAKALKNKVKAIREHKSQIRRTPFDKVATSLAIMRAAVVPEQFLGSFGEEPPKLAQYAEIFSIARRNFAKGLVESFSGVRGIYGTDLTENIAEAYGYVFGSWLKAKVGQDPKIVIGRDTRPSGKRLLAAMTRGLERAHCHIFNVGIGTTPLIQFEVRNRKGHGGVIITASHNEPDWNGFKFLWRDGGILKPEDMDDVIKIFHEETDDKEAPAPDQYIKFIEKTLGRTTVKKIREARLKVVVDPNGGAMIVVIKKLFEHLKIKTVELNMDLGVFHHKVEPTADALTHMGPIVKQHKADLGVAWDCDGDRVEMILPDGRLLSGHYILALLVDEILSGRVKNKTVVVSSATSQVVADVAQKRKGKIIETDVGEANVVKKMYQMGAPVGGEGSCGGGIIPPSRGRDGVLTLMKIMGMMVKRKETVAKILKNYPIYFTTQKKVKVTPEGYKKLQKNIKKYYADHRIKTMGGKNGALKIFLPSNSFVLFRPSKTEKDILRIVCDAPTKKQVEQIMEEAVCLIS